MHRLLILTPMDTEEKAARKALHRAGAGHVPILRTGIGRVRVTAALSLALTNHSAAHPPTVILFGVAGGLVHATPIAPRLTRVIDEHGSSWPCSVAPPRRDNTDRDHHVVGVDRLVAGPAGKRDLHTTSHATVVDMESHAFAAAATHAGVPFAIVRGVSDGPEHELPARTLDWVHPDGRSRPGRFVRDVALRPWLIPTVARTIPQVFRGLREGAARLAELVGALERGEVKP